MDCRGEMTNWPFCREGVVYVLNITISHTININGQRNGAHYGRTRWYVSKLAQQLNAQSDSLIPAHFNQPIIFVLVL